MKWTPPLQWTTTAMTNDYVCNLQINKYAEHAKWT